MDKVIKARFITMILMICIISFWSVIGFFIGIKFSLNFPTDTEKRIVSMIKEKNIDIEKIQEIRCYKTSEAEIIMFNTKDEEKIMMIYSKKAKKNYFIENSNSELQLKNSYWNNDYGIENNSYDLKRIKKFLEED